MNKISFTSVLKNKGASRKFSTSQYSSQNQSRRQSLTEIFRQFELCPEQDFTLNFNLPRGPFHRSRNSSINMVKSKTTNEDPEMDLDTWVQSQKVKERGQGICNTLKTHKSFKNTLNKNLGSVSAKKSKSNFQSYSQKEQYDSQYQSRQSRSSQNEVSQTNEENATQQTKTTKINPTNFIESQYSQGSYSQAVASKDRQRFKKPTAEELLARQQFRERSSFPEMEEKYYQQLRDEFEKVKAEKIAELCMQTRKSLAKQKIQQVVSKALGNIYEEIQELAEKFKQESFNKQAITDQQFKRESLKQDNQEHSQTMLISDQRPNSQTEEKILSESQEEKRMEQIKNQIKGYITGIQEAKHQGKINRSSQLQESSHQCEAIHQNTFNGQSFSQNRNEGEQICLPLGEDSVGYSFANNMICQHSFSRDLLQGNQEQKRLHKPFFGSSFQDQPPIYEPQQEQQETPNEQTEQKVREVGDEEISYQSEKKDNNEKNNIKNIQSVNFQPADSTYEKDSRYRNNSQQQKASHHSPQQGNTFKNFASQYSQVGNQSEKSKENKTSLGYVGPKFVSKTFNAYLSGDKKIGQSSKAKSSQGLPQKETLPSQNENKYSHQTIHGIKMIDSMSQELRQPLKQVLKEPLKQELKVSKQELKSNTLTCSKTSHGYQLQQSLHQLESKSKITIEEVSMGSPMAKIQELQKQEQSADVINKFSMEGKNNGSGPTQSRRQSKKQESPYALSSPVGQYKVRQSFQQQLQNSSSNGYEKAQYAFSNPMPGFSGEASFSHHEMPQNYKKSVEDCGVKFSNQGRNSLLEMRPLTLNGEENEQKGIIQRQIQAQTSHQQSSRRVFLETAKSKQSLEVSIDINVLNKESNSMKKITLKGASSPKTITVSALSPKSSISREKTPSQQTEKENIFQKLSIKQSVSLTGSINQQTSIQSKQIQNLKNERETLRSSKFDSGKLSDSRKIQISQKSQKVQPSREKENYQDGKENKNILNESSKGDWKNESLKFDLNLQNNLACSKTQLTHSKTEKTQPLLKMSKQNNKRGGQEEKNKRPSIGESIRVKIGGVQQSMAASKGMLSSELGNSIKRGGIGGKESFKMKKSLAGNESDMDFDLELD